MTILDPLRAEQEERAQRRASCLLTLLAIVVSLACLFFAYVIFVPGTRMIPVGAVSDFPVGRQVERAVPQLSMSAYILNRPDVSEDLVYITHRENDGWLALLGVDVQSGCFLRWDEQQQLFEDACSGRRYDRQGRNTQEGSAQPDMARMPVEVDDGQVYVVDRLCREEQPCR